VLDMAVFAINAEGRSDELHGGDDLISGNVFEDLNILELLRRGLWRARRGSARGRGLLWILRTRSKKRCSERNE